MRPSRGWSRRGRGSRTPVQHDEEMRERLAAQVSVLARDGGRSVGVAESLTGGMLAQALAVSGGASAWFRGGLVAYAAEVKHEVLGVPEGPVVTAEAAAQMARGARRLLGADVAVAVTGAGGPDPQDGQDPGTVFLAVCDGTGVRGEEHRIAGDPGRVCAVTTALALRLLVSSLGAGAPSAAGAFPGTAGG